jgi:hypothetical protein
MDLDLLFQGIRTVALKTMSDPAFRQLAIANPGQAWLTATGTAMPAQLDLQFQNNGQPGLKVLVGLPPAGQVAALSDADMDAIAGGGDVSITGAGDILPSRGKDTDTACIRIGIIGY